MFNVNGPEMLVIAIIFLLLFGPERVPEMAVRLGRLLYELRQAAEQATSEFTREIELAAGDIEGMKSDFESVSELAKKALGSDLGSIGASVLASPKGPSTAGASTAEDKAAPTPSSATGEAGGGEAPTWRPPTAEELAATSDRPTGESADAPPPADRAPAEAAPADAPPPADRAPAEAAPADAPPPADRAPAEAAPADAPPPADRAPADAAPPASAAPHPPSGPAKA